MPAWHAMSAERGRPAAADRGESATWGAPGPREPFAYAPLRVVPRVERGECVNVGIILFCRSRRFLGARSVLDQDRLRALAPDLDLEGIARHLALIDTVAAGDPTGGAIARLPASERFGWLVAPASTVVQPGPVHTGLTADPAAALERLFATLVSVAGESGDAAASAAGDRDFA